MSQSFIEFNWSLVESGYNSFIYIPKTAVAIEVLLESEVLGETAAKDLRPGVLRRGLPRLGYVGFHFQFPNELPTGTQLICRVEETGQIKDSAQLQLDA